MEMRAPRRKLRVENIPDSVIARLVRLWNLGFMVPHFSPDDSCSPVPAIDNR